MGCFRSSAEAIKSKRRKKESRQSSLLLELGKIHRFLIPQVGSSLTSRKIAPFKREQQERKFAELETSPFEYDDNRDNSLEAIGFVV
jgi:hypothetical protein